ncbi:MAG TPA: sensor domain-containing diguanylate cyclase [Acidimicrobiales bacterium]|nr:sensor domain-containing diguanylate cyclase [Acidimicrobiales bacterium]
MKPVEEQQGILPEQALGLEDYEAMYQFSMDAVMLTVPDGRILAANPAACEMLLLSEDELIRRGRQGVADPSDQRWAASIAERQRLGQVRSELSFRRGDGTTLTAEVASNVFINADGEQRSCVVFRDITERIQQVEQQARLVEEFRGLSLLDELTGVRNRRGLKSGAEALLAIADRQHASVQALFIDVDNLKELNDRHGHRTGDDALIAVARALQRCVRAADLVARVGGDEFIVLMLDADASFGEIVSRRIVAELERSSVPGTEPVSVSIGRATREPGTQRPVQDLMAEADKLMYASRAERHRREAEHR